jgi:hypothetical protein
VSPPETIVFISFLFETKHALEFGDYNKFRILVVLFCLGGLNLLLKAGELLNMSEIFLTFCFEVFCVNSKEFGTNKPDN